MIRYDYYFRKIKIALKTGVLGSKVKRFLVTKIRRPFVSFAGYLALSPAERRIDMRSGFRDHRSKEARNISDENIERIIRFYRNSKLAQKSCPPQFEIKGLWEEWLAINYQEHINNLNTENMPALRAFYANLFREPITIGTGGFDDVVHYRRIYGKIYLKALWMKYFHALRDLEFDFNKLKFPGVGNQVGSLRNGSIISVETLRHAYYGTEIGEILRGRKGAVVAEIGGGIGGQAFQTMTLNPDLVRQYRLFDIPEVASLSAFFLLSAFPGKRIHLFGETMTGSESDYDLCVYPHFEIENLKDQSIDLFFNDCSFSEMDSRSSLAYLSVIERACRGFFMHINHEETFVFNPGKPDSSINCISSKLVPDHVRFKRLLKKPRVHGRPEDLSFVYFQYLYERLPGV